MLIPEILWTFKAHESSVKQKGYVLQRYHTQSTNDEIRKNCCLLQYLCWNLNPIPSKTDTTTITTQPYCPSFEMKRCQRHLLDSPSTYSLFLFWVTEMAVLSDSVAGLRVGTLHGMMGRGARLTSVHSHWWWIADRLETQILFTGILTILHHCEKLKELNLFQLIFYTNYKQHISNEMETVENWILIRMLLMDREENKWWGWQRLVFVGFDLSPVGIIFIV